MPAQVMMSKEAVEKFVKDGQLVCFGGFTHGIPFAIGHEMIRQGKRHLAVCKETPDLIVDQLLAAGCIDKLMFSWAGNPGVGSLHAFRRAVEQQIPTRSRLRSIRTSSPALGFSPAQAVCPSCP